MLRAENGCNCKSGYLAWSTDSEPLALSKSTYFHQILAQEDWQEQGLSWTDWKETEAQIRLEQTQSSDVIQA